ncbi:hypothetical protein B0H13DRAFT_1928833 [Mycena leptocephala]|nr:hypothetical protein B0H13DRAFT_1928833 [Mycena leptocephala]
MSGKGRRESKSQGSRGPECEDHCGTDEATIKNTIVNSAPSRVVWTLECKRRHDHIPRRRSVAPPIPSYIHSKSEKCQGRERDAYPASFQSSHATRSRGCMRVASKEFRLVVNKDGRGGVARGRGREGTRRWWWYENKKCFKLRPPLSGYDGIGGVLFTLIHPKFY